MSQSNPSFQLIQTLRKSPALFRCRFCPDRTASLSRGDPLYKLHYLGTEKIYSLDMEQAQGAISRLLQQRAPEKPGKAHALVVRPRYVEVKDIATGRQLAKTYLRDIAFCAADTDNPNVFLYICKQQGPQLQLQCRVFWCSSAERAKDITACLAQSFQTALRDWQGQGVEPNHTGDGEGPSVVGGLSISASHHPDSFTVSAELRTVECYRKDSKSSVLFVSDILGFANGPVWEDRSLEEKKGSGYSMSTKSNKEEDGNHH